MKQSEMVALLDAFEETTFDAGADVIAQGAEGTHVYVVTAGALSVAKDGTQIATLGAGPGPGFQVSQDRVPWAWNSKLVTGAQSGSSHSTWRVSSVPLPLVLTPSSIAGVALH